MKSIALSPTRSASFALQPSQLIAIGTISIVLLAAFAFIGERAVWEPDEGRYLAVALQMLRSGDWMHLALNDDLPHYTKPPLTYWLLASSMSVFGINEWAARIPGAIAFAATAAIVGGLASRLAPGRSIVAAIIYATSALPFFASNIVTTDTLLTMWATVAMLGYVRANPCFDPPNVPQRDRISPALHRSGLLLMWTAFGLAFMTKGPPGLLPLVAIAVFHFRSGGLKSVVQLLDPIGLVVFCVIAFTWYAVIILDDPALLSGLLRNEVYARLFTAEHNRNPEWYFALLYPLLLIAGLMPWCFAWMTPAARRSFRWRALSNPSIRLLMLWTIVPLIVFMLAPSRMILYMVPLMPPLAIATARLQPRRWVHSRNSWVTAACTLIALLAIRVWLAESNIGRGADREFAMLDMPDSVHEILYVNARPRFGVCFYARREVEEVVLAPQDGFETLDDELSEREGELLLVMPADRAAAVRRALVRNDWHEARTAIDGVWMVMHVLPPA